MRRNKLVYRVLLAATLAWSLLHLSCVPVGVLYPSVSYVPPVPVTAPADEVRAFRVDVIDRDNCIDFYAPDRYLFSPLSLSRAQTVPAQVGMGVDSAWIWHCIALSYSGSTHHSVLVRLYRPGWQTVQVRSWTKAEAPVWKEAATEAEQEKAIDDLLSTRQTVLDYLGGEQGQQYSLHLAAGSASVRHREVLLFAAGEYERLAATGPDEAAPSRLADKAKQLRDLAGE